MVDPLETNDGKEAAKKQSRAWVTLPPPSYADSLMENRISNIGVTFDLTDRRTLNAARNASMLINFGSPRPGHLLKRRRLCSTEHSKLTNGSGGSVIPVSSESIGVVMRKHKLPNSPYTTADLQSWL